MQRPPHHNTNNNNSGNQIITRFLASIKSDVTRKGALDYIHELIKQGLDVNVEDWRAKAQRLREIYQRPDTPAPAPGSRERENYIPKMEEEENFVNSIRELICFALGVYANDIIKTREDIPWQIVIREPTPEQVQTFIKMDDVGRQLKMIQIAMEKDWCGK